MSSCEIHTFRPFEDLQLITDISVNNTATQSDTHHSSEWLYYSTLPVNNTATVNIA